jgi:cyclopropane fatty-acyl-phospholipid synthase-like methyltransferase
LLDVQPTDTILDIGCGDGPLTAEIAAKATRVIGVDSSKAMIEAADYKFGSIGDSKYYVVNCEHLDARPELVNGSFDKVFSNAAMHWILRNEATRETFFKSVWSALKPGGNLVFECGGHGNVAEVHAALVGALVHQGISIEQARITSPWYFASDTWMKSILEKSGFEVVTLETEYRPTELTKDEAGGLAGW